MKPDYEGYERAKALWILLNPDASSERYEYAMRLLAKRYGV